MTALDIGPLLALLAELKREHDHCVVLLPGLPASRSRAVRRRAS